MIKKGEANYLSRFDVRIQQQNLTNPALTKERYICLESPNAQSATYLVYYSDVTSVVFCFLTDKYKICHPLYTALSKSKVVTDVIYFLTIIIKTGGIFFYQIYSSETIIYLLAYFYRKLLKYLCKYL